jgi:hypothetical protein
MHSPQASSSTRDRTSYALLFVALFVPFSYFNHNDGWNQAVRIAELHAIVLQGTLRIDAYHQITGDKALIDGHYYSEKAPGIVALALPPFAVTVWLQRLLGVDPDAQPAWRVSEWVSTAISVGVLTALGGVAFFAMLQTRFDSLTAVLATFALFLGSLTWPYAASLFAHSATIGLLSIALWAALGNPSRRRDFIAGAAAGLAVASEYPAVIPCAVLGLYLGSTSLPRMWRFGLGTIPGALLILANNYLTTGSLLAVSYGANANFPEISADSGMGFNRPDLAVMLGLLWGEYRGLFFWCPVLLMSLIGIVELIRRERAIAVLVIATVALILLQVAAFVTAFGGNAIGPRYLAPALPCVGLAAAYGIRRWPELGLILLVASIVSMGLVTAIAIDPPGDVLTPLQSFYLVRWREHRFADNLGTLLGAPLWLSLLLPLVFPALAAWRLLRKPRVDA